MDQNRVEVSVAGSNTYTELGIEKKYVITTDKSSEEIFEDLPELVAYLDLLGAFDKYPYNVIIYHNTLGYKRIRAAWVDHKDAILVGNSDWVINNLRVVDKRGLPLYGKTNT